MSDEQDGFNTQYDAKIVEPQLRSTDGEFAEALHMAREYQRRLEELEFNLRNPDFVYVRMLMGHIGMPDIRKFLDLRGEVEAWDSIEPIAECYAILERALWKIVAAGTLENTKTIAKNALAEILPDEKP